MEVDLQTITSLHLNATFVLPDIVAWELTERTDSWINVHWLEKRTVLEAVNAETELTDLDREQSYSVRAGFRSLPDPTDLELKKICRLLNDNNKRKNNIYKRPLVHYNGHSVEAGNPEEKLFLMHDDRYTGKINRVDASLVQEWLEMPAVFVYDCDSAGRFLEGLSEDNENLHLASCGVHEKLPELQRDLFSRVLSCPVQTALKWHGAKLGIAIEVEKLGNLKDKKSLLGQLNWISSIVTDTIAYNALSKEVFEKLFREDLLVGTLWRRFLLAQRILKDSNCAPISHPPVPDCSEHLLWSFWDSALNNTLEHFRFEEYNGKTLIDEFFHEALSRTGVESLPLVLEALQLTKHSAKALEILQRDWPTIQNNSYLLGNMMYKLSKLLSSKNVELFNSSAELLAEIVRQDFTLGSQLPAFSCTNLCNNLLTLEIGNGQILKQLYLLVAFMKSESGAKFEDVDVRMLTLFLVSTVNEVLPLDKINQLQNFLEDSSPKVRAAALKAWIAANSESMQADCVINKIIPMIFENSCSLLMRRELTSELKTIAVEKLAELIAVTKQNTGTSIILPKPSKIKSKPKQKKCAQQNNTSSDTMTMAKVWRVINILCSDPDPETASVMQSLVAFVKQSSLAVDTGANKKTIKKKTAIEKNRPFLLAPKESFIEVALRELFEKSFLADVAMANGDADITQDLAVNAPNGQCINQQLRSFPTQRAPELIHFGPQQQLAFAYRDRVVWQNYTEDCNYSLKPVASTGDSCTTVSSLLFLPSATTSHLLVGHSNGVVRVWQSNVLLSAWQALYDMDCFGSSRSTDASKGLLLCAFGENEVVTAGESKQIRVWDLNSEMMTTDLPTGVDQPITALVNQNRRNIVAGFADGSMRIYDLRTAGSGKVTVTAKHIKSVCSIGIQSDNYTVISACVAGTVTVMDWRKLSNPVKSWCYDQPVSNIAIHEQLQLVAGTIEAVDVRSVLGEELYKVYRTDGDGNVLVEGARKRCPSSSVAFHPTKPLMCTGYKDNTAVLYGAQAREAN
ncbi:regulatory-associated protein of mTOR-like [Sabethes cyaneus]|uniref:regulatory-associated protein of mTOR-like n=1 Tax=Sabethes cyaneus TaxID=53552 RepID=UPI00237E2C4F|nr:regulatory-associated protein of mTOR-like [Sabethes cyaneus]